MRVAIIGGALSGKEAFEEEWDEYWILGNQADRYTFEDIKGYIRIFEIHDDLSEHGPKYPQQLADLGKELIVCDKFPVKDEHIARYPKEEIKNILGGEYLSSSPAYMMAYAIRQKVTEIGIYGIDMAVNDHEYFKQRPAMYAWIGYAKGKGIKITIPESSSLCKDTYDEGRDWGKTKGPFSEAAFQEMLGVHKAKMDEAMVLYHSHDGAMQAYKHMAKVARALEGGQKIDNLTQHIEVL